MGESLIAGGHYPMSSIQALHYESNRCVGFARFMTLYSVSTGEISRCRGRSTASVMAPVKRPVFRTQFR